MNFRAALYFFNGLLIFGFLLGCATAPISGRNQLKLLPEGQLVQMASSQYQDVIKKSEVLTSGPNYVRLQRVGKSVKQGVIEYFQKNPGKSSKSAEDYNKLDWEFTLIKSDQLNAWAMPGGKVAFYTGIMKLFENDDQCAAVMAHELAHVIAGHGNERMSQGLIQQVGLAGLSIALKEKPALTQKLFLTSFGLGATYLAVLPFGRMQESEADQLGMVFMAMAGHNPRQAITFWETMSKQSQNSTPEFLSTHPAPETRIKRLKSYLPEAQKYYNKS